MSNDGKTLSREQAMKVAKLACLKISDQEIETLTGNLNDILGYVGMLSKVDVSGIEPTSHAHGSSNVFRPDELVSPLTVEELLKIAPSSSGRFIKVPIVIDQE